METLVLGFDLLHPLENLGISTFCVPAVNVKHSISARPLFSPRLPEALGLGNWLHAPSIYQPTPLVYSWYRSSFLPIDWVGSLKSPAVAERLNLQDCHWHSSDVYQTSGKVYQGMLIPTKSQKVPASVVHKTIPGICWLADQLHHIDKGATESEVSVWPSCWVKAPKLIVRQCVSLQLASFPSKCCWRAGRKAPFPGNHCVRMDSDGQCLIEFSWAFCIAHRDSRTKKMRLGAHVNP